MLSPPKADGTTCIYILPCSTKDAASNHHVLCVFSGPDLCHIYFEWSLCNVEVLKDHNSKISCEIFFLTRSSDGVWTSDLN